MQLTDWLLITTKPKFFVKELMKLSIEKVETSLKQCFFEVSQSMKNIVIETPINHEKKIYKQKFQCRRM